MTNFELALAFAQQLVIILIAAQVFGYLAKFIGQPRVVGEMIAGVVLGPSLFGLFFPELQKSIFIADTTKARLIIEGNTDRWSSSAMILLLICKPCFGSPAFADSYLASWKL